MEYPKDLRLLNDKILRTRCSRVKNPQEIAQWLPWLETVMVEAKGIGLAAPQVGITQRFFVYDVGYGFQCAINPEILQLSEPCFLAEGCLSIPNSLAFVPRFNKCLISMTTVDGDKVEGAVEGLEAHVFQHEIDHLNGVLYIDRLSWKERRRIKKEFKERFLRP